MNPEAFKEHEDDARVQIETPGKGRLLPEELPNGEYGLVINGHSLVRQRPSLARGWQIRAKGNSRKAQLWDGSPFFWGRSEALPSPSAGAKTGQAREVGGGGPSLS